MTILPILVSIKNKIDEFVSMETDFSREELVKISDYVELLLDGRPFDDYSPVLHELGNNRDYLFVLGYLRGYFIFRSM